MKRLIRTLVRRFACVTGLFNTIHALWCRLARDPDQPTRYIPVLGIDFTFSAVCHHCRGGVFLSRGNPWLCQCTACGHWRIFKFREEDIKLMRLLSRRDLDQWDYFEYRQDEIRRKELAIPRDG